MARIVCITNGLSGGLNATLELARRLDVAGHEISLIGHRDVGPVVEAHDFEYVRVDDDDRMLAELQGHITAVGRARAVPDGRRLRRAFSASTAFADAVAAQDADALIVDVEAHYAILDTRELGLPTLLKSDWFSMTRRRGLPPLHVSSPLPTTTRERFAADADWAVSLGKRLVANTVGELHPQRVLRRFAPFRYDTVHRSDLRAVARARQISLRSLTKQTNWLYPHTYAHLPMIATTAAEVDFGSETDPFVTSVGPMVHRDRIDLAVSAEDRERWRAFRNRSEGAGRPLIYCSFGTFQTGTVAMTEKVIQAVAARPEWSLVVGRGGREAATYSSHGENILDLPYAPQAEVLASSNLAAIHGGINTVNECIVLGVPMLVEATGRGDMPGVTARVSHHGLGSVVSLTAMTPESIAAQIDQALRDAALQRRVRAMQATIGKYETEQVAEKIVDRLIDKRI